MKFAIVNLGCKVNRVESDAFMAAFLDRGAVEVAQAEANVIAINTCTVTGEAEKKTRKAVRHALRANAQATVVVTGCAVAIDAAAYESMDARIRVVGKAAFLAAINQGDWDDATRDSSIVAPVSSTAIAPLRLGEGFRTRVGVKIQDGCDNACTYCIVHVARGCATSRGVEEVVSECVAYAHAGVKEIVLTGINLGSYRDENPGESADLRLVDLLRILLDRTSDIGESEEPSVRFRLSSIEPRDVDEGLIDLLAQAQGRICRHLHLPLQSGSSKVLREMARPYTADRFCKLVDDLYRRIPYLTLSTDIIVGFPGETAQDFEETLALAERCRFVKIHVFPYSKREGTPAATRLDQVPSEEKSHRAAALRALAQDIRTQEYARRIGTCELALVESEGRALTESYFEVPAPPLAKPGSLVEIVLHA